MRTYFAGIATAACLSLLSGCASDHSTSAAKGKEAKGEAGATVNLEDIALGPLMDRIAGERDKVIVVDTWASWCIPCKQEFPHLLELCRKYTGLPVVCMSVTIDDAEARPAALAFLKQVGATFANYRITDDKSWTDRWEIKSIPVVLVFGKDGKLARKFDMDDPDHQFTYGEVEEFVKKLLAQ
jgi:thiol-disulfide isomerase/thioredoxin